MAGNTATLQIRVQVDSNGNIILTNLNQRLNETDRAGRRASGGVSSFEQSMRRLVAIVGSYLSLQTAKSILTLADHYNTVVGRVKLYTESIEETKAVEEQLYKQSQLTGTSMNTNVQFFARLSAAAKSYNLSAKDRLKLEETLNKTMIISGVTSGEASSILLQFSQALSKGKLDGDEFRSMAENNVVWTAKLAEQLGVTKGELIEMSRSGQLTVDTLFNAMRGMAESVDKEFDKMPVSIERAKQEMVNAFEYAIAGGGNAADGVSRIASGMEDLASTIQANTPAIQAIFEAIITGADGAIRLVSGVTGGIQYLAAAATSGFGSIFQDLATFADYFGIAGEAAKEWKQTSDAAYASAKDLAEKAEDNFRNVIRSSKEVKAAADAYKESLGGTGQALLDQLDDQKKVEIEQLASIQRVINADKAGLAERDTMRSAFYRMDAEKMRQQAAEWEKSGWLESARDAYKAADDLMLKSQIVSGKYDEALKANAVAIEAVIAAQEGREVHHAKSLGKMTRAEKKAAKEQKEIVDDLYKRFGIAVDGYYEKEAQKILDTADKWRQLGVDEVTVQNEAYDKITDLAKAAYDNNDALAGKYLTGLTAQFTAAVRSITPEQAKLVDKFEEINGYEIAIDDTTDWEAIKNDVEDAKHVVTDAQEEIITKFEQLSGYTLEIDDKTDWAGIKADIKAMEEEEKKLDKTAKIDADTANADKKISTSKEKAEELDKKTATVKIAGDATGFNQVADQVNASISNMTGSLAVNTQSAEELKAAIKTLNETPTLDPFGETRKQYQSLLADMQKATSDAAEQRKQVEIAAAQESARKVAEEQLSAAKNAYAEQLAAAKAAAENQYNTVHDSLEKQISAAKEAAEKQYNTAHENIEKQIADVKEAEQQKIAVIKTGLEKQIEAIKTAAEKEVDIKRQALEDQISSIEKFQKRETDLISAYSEIYKDAGVGGFQYFTSQADALYIKAQEFKDKNVESGLVEKWLQKELADLREEALEAGVQGLNRYVDELQHSYITSGNFSDSTVKARNEISSLNDQLQDLNEHGLDNANRKIGNIQERIDDLAKVGLPAAQQQILSLERQLQSLEAGGLSFVNNAISQLEQRLASLESSGIASFMANATESTQTFANQVQQATAALNALNSSSQSSTTGRDYGLNFFTGPSKVNQIKYTFAGGGYTWDGPRSGGIDGIGGRPVLLHSNETVVDHNNPDRSAISSLYNKFVAGQSGSGVDNSVKIQQLTVQVSQVSNLDTDTIIANIKRKLMRA